MATVHEGRKLPCLLCTREFKFKINLESHIKKVHMNPDRQVVEDNNRGKKFMLLKNRTT